MKTVGKLRAQKHNWRHMMIISFIFYVVIVGDNEALVNKIEILVNDMVSMQCYTNPSIDIQWHFNSLINYVFAGGKLRYPYNERFRTEDDNAGTYTLIIPQVKREDAGWYYCIEELSGRLINSTHLTVLYSDLVCYSNMHPNGFIGPNTCDLQQENMTFNCVVSFNGISPHLMWRSLNDNRTINSSICEDKTNIRNCSLILTPDPIYDGSIFICQTTALMDSRFNCSTEAIKILYFISRNDTAKKYVNDNVNCSTNSNLDVKYNWTLKQNNKTAFLSSSQTLAIQKPGIYQCEVNYSIRNYSCLSVASVMNVSVESTNGGTTSGTTITAIVLPTVLMFAVFSAGIILILWRRKRKKRKRERREEFERRENEIREYERIENEIRENEIREEYERKENERIRNRIEGMYTDFVSKVNAMRVVDLLVQKHIISKEDGDNVLNKETTEDSCRALLDHLFSSSHRETFIVLKEALSECYPSIVARIDSDPVIQIRENERIKDKVISMYIDFTSEVDPKNVLDHLIQNRIVRPDEKQRIVNKDTVKERCRALIDHLFCCSKENAFIVLKEALKKHYPRIVERVDDFDSGDEDEDDYITSKLKNDKIRNTMIGMYSNFVSDVDPQSLFDLLIQSKIVNIKQKHFIMKSAKKEERCRALLDHLLFCSKEKAFIILKEALKEHYPGMVERIDTSDSNTEIEFSTRFESCIIVAGLENDEGIDQSVVKIKLTRTTEVNKIEPLPSQMRIDEVDQDLMKININEKNEVSTIGQLPPEMIEESAAVVYDNSLFVTGLEENCDKIWKFDARSSKWEYCNTMIRGRRKHSVAFVDHVLYICGGWVEHDKMALDDVEAYDTIDDKCTTVGKLVRAVQKAGNCVPFKSSLYIFGGLEANRKAVDCIQVYDTKLNACSLLSKRMPLADCLLRVVLWEKKAILLTKNNCLIYNFDTRTWQMRNKFKTDIYHFGLIVHNEKLFVIGGGAYDRDDDGNKKWICRDDVRSVPVENVLNNESIEWQHHAKLPKPTSVFNFGKIEFLVQ